jgi:hypothetical protein
VIATNPLTILTSGMDRAFTRQKKAHLPHFIREQIHHHVGIPLKLRELRIEFGEINLTRGDQIQDVLGRSTAMTEKEIQPIGKHG